MRITSLTALALLCVSVAAPVARAESIVSGEPSDNHTTRATSHLGFTGAREATEPAQPKTEPNGYVQLGFVIGGATGGMYDAMALEGGVRLGRSPFWIHGLASKGNMMDLDYPASSSEYAELRAGLEVRSCSPNGLWCGIAGVDAGYRRERLITMIDSVHVDEEVLVPRFGLDVGGDGLRFRPMIEFATSPLSTRGDGIALSLAVAYQF
ncbi:MAG: hypothetical protein JWO36_1196 [Myxococcales bacterium]|nr:hypothetical protein [Myxococcales bacterium]